MVAMAVSPGMNVTAGIRVDQRRLPDYFLSPLLRCKEEGLRGDDGETLRATFNATFLWVSTLVPTHALTEDLLSFYPGPHCRKRPCLSCSPSHAPAAGRKVPRARADLLPVISLGADMSYRTVAPRSITCCRRRSSRWEPTGLYGWFSRCFGLHPGQCSMSRSAVSPSRAQFRLASQDLILRCSTGLFDVLLAQGSVPSLQPKLAR